jgi:phage gp46-like protein
MDEKMLSLIGLLIARLERISADSFWAHRASGVKGSLLRLLEKSEKGHRVRETELQYMVDLGFFILEKAAKEKNNPKKSLN